MENITCTNFANFSSWWKTTNISHFLDFFRWKLQVVHSILNLYKNYIKSWSLTCATLNKIDCELTGWLTDWLSACFCLCFGCWKMTRVLSHLCAGLQLQQPVIPHLLRHCMPVATGLVLALSTGWKVLICSLYWLTDWLTNKLQQRERINEEKEILGLLFGWLPVVISMDNFLL